MLLLALLYAIDCVLPSKRSGAGGSGNTNKKTKREDVRNSDDPIQEEGNERQSTHHLLGLTLTPYHNKDGVEVWDSTTSDSSSARPSTTGSRWSSRFATKTSRCPG